jgi:hypothetical protein
MYSYFNILPGREFMYIVSFSEKTAVVSLNNRPINELIFITQTQGEPRDVESEFLNVFR